jgi:RNA polymerase sigma factor (sigma-70 family)
LPSKFKWTVSAALAQPKSGWVSLKRFHKRHRVIGELFVSEKKRLTLLALRFTRNVVDAEDVVQAAFVRALKHTPQLIAASNRAGWLSTTVQRLAINCIQRARTKTTPNVDPNWVIAPEPQSMDWWAELDFDDVLRALDQCGIDPILRESFDLWWFHGIAYKQIAARLQILLACLICLRINVAKAQDTGTVTIRSEDTTCFIYIISKFPFDQEAMNGRAAETWVRWCAKSNSDTGQLDTVTGNSSSCSGEGDGYVGCTAETTERNDSSFTIHTEHVFYTLSVPAYRVPSSPSLVVGRSPRDAGLKKRCLQPEAQLTMVQLRDGSCSCQ